MMKYTFLIIMFGIACFIIGIAIGSCHLSQYNITKNMRILENAGLIEQNRGKMLLMTVDELSTLPQSCKTYVNTMLTIMEQERSDILQEIENGRNIEE